MIQYNLRKPIVLRTGKKIRFWQVSVYRGSYPELFAPNNNEGIIEVSSLGMYLVSMLGIKYTIVYEPDFLL